jgi:hypothetical protein
MFPNNAHITRALESLPAGPERERVWELLIDDHPEAGASARFAELETISDLRLSGRKGLITRGLLEADTQWLLAQIGVAKRGRKPKTGIS